MEIGVIDLTSIVKAVLALVAALITTFLIPWIKSKTTINQQQNMQTIAEFAIAAAEQIFGSGTGQQKKQYVLEYLKKKGYKVDDALIEGLVFELLNFDKEKEAELVPEVISDEQAKAITEKKAEG